MAKLIACAGQGVELSVRLQKSKYFPLEEYIPKRGLQCG